MGRVDRLPQPSLRCLCISPATTAPRTLLIPLHQSASRPSFFGILPPGATSYHPVPCERRRRRPSKQAIDLHKLAGGSLARGWPARAPSRCCWWWCSAPSCKSPGCRCVAGHCAAPRRVCVRGARCSSSKVQLGGLEMWGSVDLTSPCPGCEDCGPDCVWLLLGPVPSSRARVQHACCCSAVCHLPRWHERGRGDRPAAQLQVAWHQAPGDCQ